MSAATLERCRVCVVAYTPSPDDYRADPLIRVCPACRADDAPGARPDHAAAAIEVVITTSGIAGEWR